MCQEHTIKARRAYARKEGFRYGEDALTSKTVGMARMHQARSAYTRAPVPSYGKNVMVSKVLTITRMAKVRGARAS